MYITLHLIRNAGYVTPGYKKVRVRNVMAPVETPHWRRWSSLFWAAVRTCSVSGQCRAAQMTDCSTLGRWNAKLLTEWPTDICTLLSAYLSGSFRVLEYEVNLLSQPSAVLVKRFQIAVALGIQAQNCTVFGTPQLHQILTDFQNYFTVRIRRKCVIILSLKIGPHTWGVVGSLVIVLLHIFSWFWQWNSFENRLIFDEVKAYQKNCAIFRPPCICCTEILHDLGCVRWWCIDLRKRFEQEPISTHVEATATVQLQCSPPSGLPAPQVC